MKRFLLNITGFFVFFLCFYLIGLFLFGKYLPEFLRPNLKHFNDNYGSTNSMLLELKEKRNIDILILGASDAYRGYDPRIFRSYGYNIFNLGSSAQTPEQTYLVLKKYLDKLNPQLIIYEVSPVCLALDGVESSLDLILNDIDKGTAMQLIIRSSNILLLNSFLYSKMNGCLFENSSKKKISLLEGESYISGGYVETKMKFNHNIKTDSVVWMPNSGQVKMFDIICKFLKKRKLNVLFINANSITDRYYKNRMTIDSFFTLKGNYIDVNKELKLNDRLDFFDTSHLNQSGVFKFNDFLINTIIKKNYQPKIGTY